MRRLKTHSSLSDESALADESFLQAEVSSKRRSEIEHLLHEISPVRKLPLLGGTSIWERVG